MTTPGKSSRDTGNMGAMMDLEVLTGAWGTGGGASGGGGLAIRFYCRHTPKIQQPGVIFKVTQMSEA